MRRAVRAGAIVVAGSLVQSLAACAPSGRDSTALPLADALRRLRHDAVGDRRLEAGARLSRPAGVSTWLRSTDPRRVGMAPQRAAPNETSRAEGAPSGAPAPTDSFRPPDLADLPTRVIPFTTAIAPAVTLWVGDTLALPAPPAPEGTPPSIERDLRWSSVDAPVASVSGGRVVAHAPGTTDVVAWRRVGQTVRSVTVLPAVRGRVVAAADGVPIRARVIVRGPRTTDSTLTDRDGTFAFRSAHLTDTRLTVRIEPLDDAHAPAELFDAPVDRLATLDALLLPRQWRITTGSYAGTAVSIEPAIAQRRARDGRRVWHVARDGSDLVPAAGAAVGWDAAQLPLAVAFDHHRNSAPSAGDSVAFWSIARQLERDWGRPLFRPATLPLRTASDDASADAPGFAGIVVAVDPRMRAAGLTTIGWSGDGDVGGATVAVQSRALLAAPAIVTHELLHALGIGHAGEGWTSVMHPVASGVGGGRASADDVAYAQLLYAMRRHATRRAGLPRGITTTPIGIAEAAAAR